MKSEMFMCVQDYVIYVIEYVMSQTACLLFSICIMNFVQNLQNIVDFAL